ncbi:protein-ribulosamine 3-kinase [Parastagonospora nodorum]|nr:protein-ribulosamine 3-kinase [Parastagonospora nodorum]KAH4198096.1 protein-ribulosamine 3-kinase [Parastagonospora nodorum]KAH5001475.1 protein-ribulosamine 3-kinase [Parastagonospora nodorum]KAH5111919.1 protein-ribulosamine 3-kinase [Parastagonospora nodorum]KAH6115746.1 protein-ribulosamine 3-kinase [Parastagonospora nodorum]
MSSELIENWQIPPKFLGKLPKVQRGCSGGKIVQGDFPLDQIVIDKLSPGTIVLSCNQHGVNEWTVVAKIVTRLENSDLDVEKSYFLKCAEYEQGRVMLEGEFESMKALHATNPSIVPEPYAWGQLHVTEPPTYFFICDFIELSNQNPDAIQLCSKLVTLHRSSRSPNNQFGFHINPLRGNLPLNTTWTTSWKEQFIQILRGTMALDQRINGTGQEMCELVESVVELVVPQVLGPLEAEGRTVKPSLIHGDLWGGNVGTDARTGEVYIFDASSYYAHHEMEVAIWRYVPNTFIGTGVYLEEYIAQMGFSEPKVQFDDRHRLYSACTALHAAACHNRSEFRTESERKFKHLLRKYT